MAVSSRFVIVGGGWRAEFFLRAARAMPEVVTCVGVTSRQATRRDELTRRYGVEALVRWPRHSSAPSDFVVLASSRESMPGLLEEIASHLVPVLLETPPGWTSPVCVGRGGRAKRAVSKLPSNTATSHTTQRAWPSSTMGLSVSGIKPGFRSPTATTR